MGGPAEHSSGTNSVAGQNLHLPASAIPTSPESPERPRGRKRTRTQVSPKSTSFYFLLKLCSHHLRFRLHHWLSTGIHQHALRRLRQESSKVLMAETCLPRTMSYILKSTLITVKTNA